MKIMTFFFLVFYLPLSTRMLAQTHRIAYWDLGDSSGAAVIGNIIADTAYSTPPFYQKIGFGLLCGPALFVNDTDGWPANETGPDFKRYIQFLVKPKAGYNLHVDSVAFWLACYGSHGYMHAAVYWNTDTTNFITNNLLDYDSVTYGAIRGLPDVSDGYTGMPHDTGFAINSDISNGGLFAMRIFPWYNDSTLGITESIVIWIVRIYGTTSPVTLPVELISFTETTLKNNINLKWETASEKNNSGFEIQRSCDKKNFEKIGFVNGHGTTTEKHIYEFSDKNLPSGRIYYRLKQIDYNGTCTYSKIIEATKALPTDFSLSQNYPNPFNPTTTINYSVPKTGLVTIKVYDIMGREVETLVNKKETPGNYSVEFNASKLSSGVYFYRMQAGDFEATKKLILMK